MNNPLLDPTPPLDLRSLEPASSPTQQLLTIVTPVFNEEENIPALYQAVSQVMDSLDLKSEFLMVDDGSRDRTFALISALAEKDDRVKCLRFSRNFGSHAALMAGLRHARGDAAVIISADLQDPPDLIPELVRQWREGYQVVWAVRAEREDPFFKKLYAKLFYAIFRRIALPDYPAAGMDFGLFDRAVLDSLGKLQEVNQFLTGMIVWLGFRQAHIPYHRQERHAGYSKWSFGKRIKNAIDGIISFSYFPVRFMSYLGLLISFISFLLAIALVVRTLTLGLASPGWPSVMVAILFMGGMQMIMLGVLGEYIWRGNEQSKGRPQYVVMETVGFEK